MRDDPETGGKEASEETIKSPDREVRKRVEERMGQSELGRVDVCVEEHSSFVDTSDSEQVPNAGRARCSERGSADQGRATHT